MRFGRPALVVMSLILSAAVQPVVEAAPLNLSAGTTSTVAPDLCAPPADTVAPAITEVTFSEPSISLQAQTRVQTITALASDISGNGEPSGVTRLTAAIRGPHFGAGVKLHLVSGTGASGTWSGQFEVSKYAHPGTYSITFLAVVDGAGNLQYYRGYSSVADSPSALSLHPSLNPTFEVTGTPATLPPRKPAGTLSKFSLTPSSVNTTASIRHVHFVARFDGAAPARVYVSVHSVTKTISSRFVYVRAVLHKDSGRWIGAVAIPRWIGDQALQVDLYASFGSRYLPRSRDYDADRLHRLHFPNRISVVSGVDKTDPVLKSLSVSPSAIDSTAGPQQVTVTARASDTHSGVRYIAISGGIRHGINGVDTGSYPHAAAGIGYLSSENFRVRLKKTASGQWVGTTTVRQCVPSGTYRLSASLADVAGNNRYYTSKKLAAAQLVHTVEVTSKHGDTAPPFVFSAATYGASSSLFLNFSEGVANVSTSTVAVYALSPKATRFTSPATITGIVCSNGVTTVDCSGSGDLVTSAVLTIPEMTPGITYDVYTNLDQVVPQLTDGNGNPMQWTWAAAQVIDA